MTTTATIEAPTKVEAIGNAIVSVSVTLLQPTDAIPGQNWEWELPRRFWGDCKLNTILENGFRQGNHVDGTEYVAVTNSGLRCRSMSVGDIVTIKVVDFDSPSPSGMLQTKERHFRCEGCGWSELTTKGAYQAALKIPSRDASFSLDSLVKWGVFPADLRKDVVMVD